jgi:lipopolysaccharide/colanic/teichoic acid biosynthesis glycosyltransferase
MIRIPKLFPEWLTSAGRGQAREQLHLHSSEKMQAILDRERMRSDRGGASFTLLTFTFSRHASKRDLDALAIALHGRIRLTDDAGHLGPDRVAVILPETPAAGAWKLADSVYDLLPANVTRPECDVYVYPSEGEPTERPTEEAVPVVDEATDESAPREEPVAVADREPVAMAAVGDAQPMAVLFVRPMPAWKRAIDVIGAATALVLAAPVMAAVAVAIKLTSPGPVFFTQPRDSIGGRRFTMYKFRTMSVDAEQQKAALRALSEQDGPAFKMTNDPRVTPLGRFLRKTSLDELPQLFNILLGDMSLVGPRPLPCDESGRCEPWQRRRLDVTPGLTCIWQVRGRSAVTFCEWVRMDIEYIRSRSLVNDVKLIAETVPAVALRRGAC